MTRDIREDCNDFLYGLATDISYGLNILQTHFGSANDSRVDLLTELMSYLLTARGIMNQLLNEIFEGVEESDVDVQKNRFC